MSRTFWNAVLVASIFLWSGASFAQQGPPAGRWVNPGAGNHGRGNGGGGQQGGSARGHHWVGGERSGGSHGATAAPSGSRPRFGVASRGSVTDPSFAGRLGRTVGGFGNINSPGMQPLPTTPGFPVPNINSPGSAPGLFGGLPEGRHGGRRHGGHSNFGGVYGGGVIYYGVPYYVPVYPDVVTEAAPDQPREFDIREYRGPVTNPAPQQPESEPQAARTVTLLAFKDAMVIAVTDYWMQGYSLVYETSLGVRTVIPLDRLDWGLTQQLNFERGVPFVLEARP